MMSESETKNPLQARVAELERRLELLDEIVFEAISELGKIGAPLERSHLMLMRIFCKIDGVPEDSLDRDADAEAPRATPPSAAPCFQATTETILHACGALAFMGLRAAALDAGMPAAAETFEQILPLLGARVSQNVAMFEELMELLQAAGVIESAGDPRPGGGPALRLVQEHIKP